MKSYENKHPLDYYNELEKEEVKIYDEMYFRDEDINTISSINDKDILSRDIFVFKDYDYNLPQNIFIISSYKGQKIVGRKIRSILRIENKINAINCSMITAPMLLGFLKKKSKKGRKITLEYYPFTNEEKKCVFDDLKNNRLYDIYFPYKYRDFNSNKEEKSPENGWTFNPERKEYLGYGEVHFRKFTTQFFKDQDMSNKIIYDPACSTGEFLEDVKKSYPKSYTIGHDLSQEMVDYAKKFVDESCCCNALDSPLKEQSVDLMFLRFLNSEVVTTKDAYKIFKVLISKVKKNGIVVCFGHTPVLITKQWFIKNNLRPIICNGYDSERDAIFQYYVFEVI